MWLCCAPNADIGERKPKRIRMNPVFHIAAKPCTSREQRDAGYLALRATARRDGTTLFD